MGPGDIQPGLQPKAMSGSTVLPQPGTMLMSVVPVTIKGSSETWGLDQNPRSCWCLKVMQPPWPYGFEYPAQQRKAITMQAAAWGHVWVHSPDAAMVCVDIHGSWYHARPSKCLRSGPPPEVKLLSKGNANLSGLYSHLGLW